MKSVLHIFVAAGLLVAACASASAATTDEALASRQYLIGTWNCAHTYRDFSGTYTTRYENVLDNRWIKQTYNFPASASTPAMVGEWYMGYNPQRQTWVRFGAMTTGQYFALRMTDVSPTTSTWKYVGFFGSNQSDASSPDATFTKISDTEYKVDGPTYKLNGTGPTVTEHHDCKKAS